MPYQEEVVRIRERSPRRPVRDRGYSDGGRVYLDPRGGALFRTTSAKVRRAHYSSEESSYSEDDYSEDDMRQRRRSRSRSRDRRPREHVSRHYSHHSHHSTSRGPSPKPEYVDAEKERLRRKLEGLEVEERDRDREKRIRDRIKEEKEKEKEEEKRIRDQIKKEEEDRKKKEEERKEHEKKLKKEAVEEYEKKKREDAEKKKKEDEAYKERLELDLIKHGYTAAQIEDIVKGKKGHGHDDDHRPQYAKIHRRHVSIETLRVYQLPFELCPGEPDFMLVHRPLGQFEMDQLCEHTTRIREARYHREHDVQRIIIKQKTEKKKEKKKKGFGFF